MAGLNRAGQIGLRRGAREPEWLSAPIGADSAYPVRLVAPLLRSLLLD